MAASETADPDARFNETQRTILAYLRENTEPRVDSYFKSHQIGDDLDLSAKKVGHNIRPLMEADFLDINIKKWGYSSATTWHVTR